MFSLYCRQIVNEYNDCTQRAYRLAAAHEAYICNRDNALSTIKLEDLLIYLRWFVSHLHSMNRFHQYLKVSSECHMLLLVMSQKDLDIKVDVS